ncbi:DUF418 domain-containing protein [Psychrobium sp. nBUS_13]|uniref:DUF418 domain-containing protein n=1 Tax=Psychrobium sp. nBUS_13 TaxID=3395319 RepID=UPI003EB9043D
MNTSMDRVVSLDLLRGIAILGILFMNIVAFAMPFEAYPNVNYDGLATDTEKTAFIFQFLLAKERFISLFCVLFGAGIVMFLERARAKKFEPYPLMSHRLSLLMLFGFIHLSTLFFGDILLSYGLTGIIIYKWSEKEPHFLMRRGIIFIAVGALLLMAIAWGMSFLPADAMEQDPNSPFFMNPVGSFENFFNYNIMMGLNLVFMFPVVFWTLAGGMLIGMALMKNGFFIKGTNLKNELMLFTVGGSLSVFQLIMIFETDFQNMLWTSGSLNWVGGLMMIIAVSSRLIKIVTAKPQWLMLFQNCGKMAFTLYIFQSLTMALLFRVILADSHGDWLLHHLMAVAGVMTIIQIILANLWQHYKGQGPLEKLWRDMVYKKAKPMS